MKKRNSYSSEYYRARRTVNLQALYAGEGGKALPGNKETAQVSRPARVKSHCWVTYDDWLLGKAILICLLLYVSGNVFCQSKKPISLKDSADGKFDLSDFIIDANGFVPVPIIITEPAVGGFGGGLVPVFIKKRPAYEDSIKGKLVRTPVAPDITGAAGFYTANKTWGGFAFRSGTFIKSRIKYVVGSGYANLNISFYRTVSQLGEKEFKFNGKLVPVFLQMTKRIAVSHWYAGLKYLFLKVDLKYVGEPALPPEFVKPREYNSSVSQLGAIVELDSRDNIFTPDKGIKLHLDASVSDNFLGSDYDYWYMNYYTYLYKNFTRKFVGGLRIDGQQALGDPPFFLLPYIKMRGVAAARYQGNAALLAEAEARFDVVSRWSILFFGGTGKAFDNWSDFGSADYISSIGSGFRYLIARKFKLRVGIDVAKGPDTWAYYIVFGSNWVK